MDLSFMDGAEVIFTKIIQLFHLRRKRWRFFFVLKWCENHSPLPPRSLTCSPLKNDGKGRQADFLLGWWFFRGELLNFQGVTSLLGVASGNCCFKKYQEQVFFPDLGKPTLSFCWVNDLEPAESGFSISTATCPDLWGGSFPCCQKNGDSLWFSWPFKRPSHETLVGQ